MQNTNTPSLHNGQANPMLPCPPIPHSTAALKWLLLYPMDHGSCPTTLQGEMASVPLYVTPVLGRSSWGLTQVESRITSSPPPSRDSRQKQVIMRAFYEYLRQPFVTL